MRHRKQGDFTFMNSESFISVSAGIGGGFFGGLLLGYALKKVVKLIAVIVGLFIAGLASLQYQQIASFDWNRIEGVVTATLGNVTSQISSGQDGALRLLSTWRLLCMPLCTNHWLYL